MTTIIIARHGNTFNPGDTVLRVGRTDLPLSSSGKQQAQRLGNYFLSEKLNFAAVYTSCLSRTIETASIALKTANFSLPILQNSIFDEINYGPDEGKTEDEVIARIGANALQDWEQLAEVPPGWLADPDRITRNWFNFAHEVEYKYPGKTVLVVTSNGIARFAPFLTGDFMAFSKQYKLKLATGAVGSLSNVNSNWEVNYWNKNT